MFCVAASIQWVFALMPTITKRQRADGSFSYRASIRLKRKGKIIYQEAKTFDRKKLAVDWARNREVELQAPGALARVAHKAVTVGDLIDRYIKEYESLSSFGRTKAMHLKQLSKMDIADIPATELTSRNLVDHAKVRRADGTGAATVNNDLIWIGVVFKVARPAWGIPVSNDVVTDAMTLCRSEKLIARSKQRDRRPSLDELNALLEYFSSRDGRASIPMTDVVLFGLFSSRRESEICSIMWDSLRDDTKSAIITDMKHPREKKGNNVEVFFHDYAWEIIQRQDKNDDRVFPYNPKSVSAAFTRSCKFLEIDDLRFHDLRHECVSWLFELGWDIPKVSSVSGHKSWSSLQRYTHFKRREPYDKYDGWAWVPV